VTRRGVKFEKRLPTLAAPKTGPTCRVKLPHRRPCVQPAAASDLPLLGHRTGSHFHVFAITKSW
jgi:hypothetical protein